MAILATRCAADDDHPGSHHPEAYHPPLAIVFAEVFSLEEPPLQDELGVLEVERSLSESFGALV